MDNTNFNKLFSEDGKPIKFTPGQNIDDLSRLNELLENHKRTKDRGPLIEAKEIIRTNEIDMSNEMTGEIREFIAKQRKMKVKERTIRRMVKKRFGIIVLPK